MPSVLADPATHVLTTRAYFGALRQWLGPLLDVDRRAYHSRTGPGRLIKIDFGHPETHYEVWHHAGRGRLEVGLHFEGARDLNQAALEHFRPHMVGIKAALPRAELEPWDRGWARLYETLPAPHLTGAGAQEAATLLAAYIATLEPILEGFWEGR